MAGVAAGDVVRDVVRDAVRNVVRSIRSVGGRSTEGLRQRFNDSTLIAAGGIVALVLGASITVLVLSIGADSPGPVPDQSPPLFTPAPVTSTTTVLILVHAAGAVRQPGLHRLASGSRVADLIEAAGGVDDSIDIDRINLAAPVTDGERVYLPRRGESIPLSVQNTPGSGEAALRAGPLDLNSATQQQLEELPGVGPATAAAILSARNAKGRFSSVDDLLDVRGIGLSKLEQLREHVAVR